MDEEIKGAETVSTPEQKNETGTQTKVNTTPEKEKVDNNSFDKLEDLDNEDENTDKEENKEKDKEPKVEKTYTEKQLQEIFDKRIGRLTAQHKKELEELEARYKEGNYSPEIASLQEKLNESNEKYAKMQKDLARYEIDNAFMKSSIKDEYRDYVEYKVLRMVDENKDFSKCLDEFKTQGENSKYFKSSTGGTSIVPPRPNNSSANTELIAGESNLKKAMGL